ncbi:hypothetical protein BCR32DRAFT_269313 [Anaeromyces robustus]|uniref:RGS domain-containing protein n=1 Tax=Anaeromyces robustus TaxID=1754192 RepID=A0A1Y1X1P6_9FUNG|nr:hypothetical protein BCR32DRAFT_269313 [Anaeromyces robustus]|eukprot:ORX79731.1 hypothetical protein BCR32DRAFT_269313 [Anaeromyces robustus]
MYEDKTFDKIILPIIWVVLGVYMSVMLILFINYRNRPQLEYRGIKLTLLYGVSSTLYVILIIAGRIFKFSCIQKLWITDICIVLSIFSVMSRGIRILYLWKLNCYKLSNTKKEIAALNNSSYELEANIYFKTIYKIINKEIAKRMIIIPVILDLIITSIVHYLVKDKCEHNPVVFAPILIFLAMFTIIFPILMYNLHKVQGYHRISIEDEYIINTIFWIILFTLYGVVEYVPKFKNNEKLQFYTNDGVAFFVFQELFSFIIIMSVPFIEIISDKRKYRDIQEEEMSIEYFYKLINDPIIIEELKEVAISEFSIENVLFWEAYRELMKLSKNTKQHNTFNKLFNGLSNVHKFNKSKSNNNNNNNSLYNMTINENSINNNQDKTLLYENKYESMKYYENLSNLNNKSINETKDIEMIQNSYSDNDYYMNYSNSGSTNNLLCDMTYSDNMNNNFAYTKCNSSLSTNYTYIDEIYKEKIENPDNNYYYNFHQQNQNQRRRSIKQYNIKIDNNKVKNEKVSDYISSSSDITADTPVPDKLINYYINFYYIFINVNSHASVNINCSVRCTIEENIENPKIGIFDEAKDEVILLMFRNLNPKLIIQLKEKQMI